MRLFFGVAAVLLQQQQVLAQDATEPPLITNVVTTDMVTTESDPVVTPDPDTCEAQCAPLTVIEEEDSRHEKCCTDQFKNVTASGKLTSYKCPPPQFSPCSVRSTVTVGCSHNFQLYFMLDIRTIETNNSSIDCTSAWCASRFISNTEMIKNWIFRVVYTIKKYKRNNPNQDFLVVVQYPQQVKAKMLVSYADEVLDAEKDFGDKIMKMAMEGQKVSKKNAEIIDALKCLTKYANEINKKTNRDLSSITCLEFEDNTMKSKLPKRNLPYKKMLFTFTHGPITMSSVEKQSNNQILSDARDVFDRMDVVSIGYRKTYEKPLFQSANGITYEYADYTDLLREKEVNTVVSAICEDISEVEEISKSNNSIIADPCLLDVIFAVDSHFCVCTTALKDACCARSEKIIQQMQKFVNQVTDKLRKKGSYILGKDHTTVKQALRVGFYSYYKNDTVLSSTPIMELKEWSSVQKTTSLDKFREAIFKKYENPKVKGASNVNKVYLRNVLEDNFDFGTTSEKFLDKFSDKFDDELTHSKVFVIFPEDDSSEESSGISNNLKLREGTLAFKNEGVDVIAMPIKSGSGSGQGLEYDAGLVNAILDTPPNGAWTALDQVENEVEYDEDRADKLVEAIYALDDCQVSTEQPHCSPVGYSCNATLEYSWSGCLMGPAGLRGNPGEDGQRGIVGPPGLPGLPGQLGPQGENGADGECGKRGPQGSQGYKGKQGFRGDQGPRGPQGPKGESGQNAKIDITSWSDVHRAVKDNCGCKTCDKTINDQNNICTDKDGKKCLKKQPVWWLGQHIDRQYFIDSIKEFLSDDFARKAADHLTMHGQSFNTNSWESYIEEVGTYLLGEEDYGTYCKNA